MIIIECEQGSPEWHAARAGMVTASKISDVCARTKSGWGASRANYMAQIVAERLTNEPADSGFSSDAMKRGTELEPEARAAYQMRSGLIVQSVGFVVHADIDGSGASPDGLVGDSGLVEIKCPNTATHIDTLLTKKIAGKYVQQMQWQMACTGRQWCDFVSYDPRLPPELELFIQRVERDATMIANIEQDVASFLDEVEDKLMGLRTLMEAA